MRVIGVCRLMNSLARLSEDVGGLVLRSDTETPEVLLRVWEGARGAPSPVDQLAQQVVEPSEASTLLRPSTAWSVISVEPVLKKSRPSLGLGFSPPRAILAIASMPSDAIFDGYCWAVAPRIPSFT